MRRSFTIISIALFVLVVTPMSESAIGCVIVTPLPEDVHAVIKHDPARELRWYLLNPESLDIPDPETGLRPLMTALLWEKPKHFRKLLELGADPDLTDPLGNTALHIAAQINKPGLVLELLEAGADPNVRNLQQHTFQTYQFMSDQTMLSGRARKEMAAVINWLVKEGVPLEMPQQR